MSNWDEIVFKKRNTEYGAYQLRKKYYRIVLISFLVVNAVVISFAAFLFYKYQMDQYSDMLSFNKSILYEIQDDLLMMEQESLEPPPPPLPEPEKTEEIINNYITTDSVPDEKDILTDSATLHKNDQESADTSGQINGKGTIFGDGDTYYTFVENMPEFPGGEKALYEFISKNVVYPAEALKNKIKGVVHVSFIIGVKGKIENIQITKSVHPMLDNEVLRVIRLMPDWRSGSQQGRNVRVMMTLPVKFF